jgi:hypothetical protein
VVGVLHGDCLALITELRGEPGNLDGVVVREQDIAFDVAQECKQSAVVDLPVGI